MKINKVITFCAGVAFPAFVTMAADIDASRPKPVKEKVEIVPLSPAPAFSPRIEFCGQAIDLKRYDMYERFDRELTTMVYMQSSTLRIIKLANRYFPVIEPILERMGIPNDMKYLAVIESSLNVRAISPAKAAGLWQFMPATGRQYGLEVNDTIDERMHVELSTIAACKYLKDMYAKFQNWPSVAAAYNIGAGRITTELENQKANTSLDLWLVEETSRYVFRILAAKELMSHPSKYGYTIKANQLYKPIRCNEVVVNAVVDDLYKFATDNNTTYYLIKDFNPWLRSKSISNVSGKLYKVKIPVIEDLNYSSEPMTPFDKNWITE
ncbi:lytic transglycosylase domain-containing protein [Parabacteroides sp. FAFU027]|uniref:lytic transglycosylase domain-containing protein n=1 Tax=Parabacteroides sp. FAFU027 TaxID=2922715 RepID=UPI001FB043D6|nr:lytic transglycosylase domain-containing protein [Parabacteroides sp. FAFU027]